MIGISVPPPPEGFQNRPSWVSDDRAKKEEENWDDEAALRGQVLKNDLLWSKLYGVIVAGLMIFFTLIFIISLGAWTIHYTTAWCWLTAEQLSKIQSVIFSGVIGAVVSSYAQKYVAGHSQKR